MATSTDRHRRESMGMWKTRIRRKAGKGSQTPGSTKGDSCQATGLDRLFATRNRSYKLRGYSQWCARKTGV